MGQITSTAVASDTGRPMQRVKTTLGSTAVKGEPPFAAAGSGDEQQPSATFLWLPTTSKFPVHATATLVRNGRLSFDNIDVAAAAGSYGEVFRGTYVDDNGIEHRVCAKRDGFLTLIDIFADDGDPPIEDDELRCFYTRVRNDLTAAWRLLGDPRVINYLAITTTTRMVASGTVVLPEYFIMEEEGETLATWLEQHPACAENRATFEGYLQCILEGLAALHSAGFTHRDIKPANIVVCRHDPSTTKLIDLGLAKPEVSFRDKAVNSMTAASLWYMAPEFMDPQRANQAVDVFAVGVMCAERLLEEQIGRHEATVLLNGLMNSRGGMQAVHNRLREAITASPSPQSLLERVASEAMLPHADARPSSIHLANAAGSAIPEERKIASFLQWVSRARHMLRDCQDHASSDAQHLIKVFLAADSAGATDIANLVDQLTAISQALASTGQRNLMLLRISRNIILSLLEYSAPTLERGTFDSHEADLHRLLARVYGKMPNTLNYARALMLFDRAIEKLQKNPTSAAAAMHDKAKTLSKMGGTANLEKAMALYNRVIEIRTTTLGAEDIQTAATMHQKAMALVALGGSSNLKEAMALYNHVIEIRTVVLGADHDTTAVTLHDKAKTLSKMGGTANLEEAMALYNRVIEIMTTSLGANHAYTAVTMHNKAYALVSMGGSSNLQAAVELYDDVIKISASVLGADHIDTTATMHAKAKALVVMGESADVREALALCDRVIEIRTAALGADHPNTAATMLQKANALVAMGGSSDLEVAMALYNRVIETNTTALGAHHTSTAEAVYNKAKALIKTGGSSNLQQAEALYDRCISIWTAALGAEHPSTVRAKQEKADVFA
jgi:serine/threonine protein kinase